MHNIMRNRGSNLYKLINLLKTDNNKAINKITKTLEYIIGDDIYVNEVLITLNQTVDFIDYVSIYVKYDNDIYLTIAIGELNEDFTIKDGKMIFYRDNEYRIILGSSEKEMSFKSGVVLGMVNMFFSNGDISDIIALEDDNIYKRLQTPLQ